jgi:hypothetical protein
MPVARRFTPDIVAALRDGKSLRIRAGTTHRFIAIWVVVVESRVFVRSWSLKARGWYRSFLKDPRGFIQLGHRTIPVVAVQIRSDRLRDAVDLAYLQKYATPGALKYAKDLGSRKSRASTIELRPASGQPPNPRLKLAARVD